VDREEFLEGFQRINKIFERSLTEDQIISIMKFLDKDGDGQISYNEFLSAFTPVDSFARRNSL
jgi:Ca2+-binding EF-hand superfamily protein